MDPGNWATDIAGGSRVRLGCCRSCCLEPCDPAAGAGARLGIATGADLAQACRARFPRRSISPCGSLARLAIIACDLAEVIGTAIALKLLFGMPLVVGV